MLIAKKNKTLNNRFNLTYPLSRFFAARFARSRIFNSIRNLCSNIF